MMNAAKNKLPESIRKSAAELLQARLADAVDLTTQTKQAHWNVKGPGFIALHQLFDENHGEMDDHTDLIAERLVASGGQAHSTARTAAANSTLSEYPLDAGAHGEHIAALSSALAAFGQSMREAIDEASNIGDQDTSDIFTEVPRTVDKSPWLVEAHGG